MNPRCRTGRTSAVAFLSLIACGFAVGAASMAAGDVAVEFVDGTSSTGRVTGLTDSTLDVVVDGAPRAFGVREVRRLSWTSPGDPRPAASNRRAVRIALVDGSVLEGDDLSVDDREASLVRDGRTFAIARESIETADFRSPGSAVEDGKAPAWLEAVRDGGKEGAVASDVVVVGSGDKNEFVECAIIAVTPEAVSVLLDDETIRVKRSKVIGLKWLRNRDGADAVSPGPPVAVVEFDGGRIFARRITIDGDEAALGLDGGEPIRVPLAAMRVVDFAAGRTVSLVSLRPEAVEIEPWFGLFKSLDGLAGHFEPRKVTVASDGSAAVGPGAREGLRLRPRTVIEWSLPEHARSVAMTLTESSSLVVISIDDREVYRGQPSHSVPVVADAAGGRRLNVTVDFPPSGPGTGGRAAPGVVLVEPRIER